MKQYTNPLDPNSTLNKETIKPNKSSMIHKQSSVSQNKENDTQSNIYRDIDEEFEYCKNTFAFESDDGFVLGEDGIVYDINRVLKFIHKAIDKSNREWEKKIRQLLDKQKPVQYQDDNGFGWAIPCKSFFESFKEIFNNLLNHKEIK